MIFSTVTVENGNRGKSNSLPPFSVSYRLYRDLRFLWLCSDVIHLSNPLHLIIRFELFGNARTFRHLFYETKKHILSLLVNVREITV